MARVYLSPSLQETNLYAGGLGRESDWCRRIAEQVRSYLLSAGHKVRMSLPDDSLTDAINKSNAWHPGAHVAIHTNAGGGEGTEVWYYPGSVEGAKIASSIYTQLAPLTPGKDRGLRSTDTFIELKQTIAPAVIVEVEFHDREDLARWITRNVVPIANRIARGIHGYFTLRPDDIPLVPGEEEEKAPYDFRPPPAPELTDTGGLLSFIARLVEEIRDILREMARG